MKLTRGTRDLFPPARRHCRDAGSARELEAAAWPSGAIAALLHGAARQLRDEALHCLARRRMRAHRIGERTAESAQRDASILLLDIDDPAELRQDRRRHLGLCAHRTR